MGSYNMDGLAQLAKEKHIALETFRKSGEPVRTPVWPMVDDNLLYVVTRSHTGKVKRIRNNPRVRVAPSSFSGDPKGDWMEGTARFAEGEEAERAVQLRKKKYGLQAMLVGMMSYSKFSKGETTVIAIQLK
jgi:PPOX class probable F420-dependent enzyme